MLNQIVSWHPVLTDHQAYTLRSLQDASGAKVNVIVAAREHRDRKKQGWTVSEVEGLTVECLPATRRVRAIARVLRRNRDAIHIFGSPFENVFFMFALLLSQIMRRRVCVISEPYSSTSRGYLSDDQPIKSSLKNLLRPLLYKIYGALLLPRISALFAISPRAVKQYAALGVDRRKIVPFGYFVSTGTANIAPPPLLGRLRLIFVGSLIEIKGLADLLMAVEDVRRQGLDIELHAYGPGDPTKFNFNASTSVYKGVIPFGTAQEVIRQYHILVLPSHYDGWGVVVNESIQAGVPVICSDQVGAGAMAKNLKCGLIFSRKDEGSLAALLSECARNREILREMRISCEAARSQLDPIVAGRYIVSVLQNLTQGKPRPMCPWYEV